MTKRKPKVFIGSSSEALPVANAIYTHLETTTMPTKWDQDVFLPGSFTLETLERQVGKFQFAVLVGTPDDILVKRGSEAPTVRDNVLFELGLFIGRIGRQRAFLVTPRSATINLPSDLSGLGVAQYEDGRLREEPGAYASATETASGLLRQAIAQEWNVILDSEREQRALLARKLRLESIDQLRTLTFSITKLLASV
jgi:CRP/FNR family transcriptional regulator, cyclic AMP receptor protein